MASCPAKYSNYDDSLEILGHNPLMSSYDRYTSTNIAVPSINDDTALLFEVERNEILGIDYDISSQLSTDDSDSDTDSPYDPYNNDYDEDSCPQAQLSTAVSKVQIKLNNLINNHKASLKLHDDIVHLFNELASPNFDLNATFKSRKTFIRSMESSYCVTKLRPMNTEVLLHDTSRVTVPVFNAKHMILDLLTD
jgi:hypothetical protein